MLKLTCSFLILSIFKTAFYIVSVFFQKLFPRFLGLITSIFKANIQGCISKAVPQILGHDDLFNDYIYRSCVFHKKGSL